MKNLTIKNECFGKVEYESLTTVIKDIALLLLMLIVIKRIGNLKTRGVVNRNI